MSEPLPESEIVATQPEVASVKLSGGGRAVEIEANFTTLDVAAEIAYQYWSKMDPGPRGNVGFAAENGTHAETKTPTLGAGTFSHELVVEAKTDDRTE